MWILQSGMDGSGKITPRTGTALTPPMADSDRAPSPTSAPGHDRTSPLRFFDTVSLGTRVNAELGGVRFVGQECPINARQLNFSSPTGLFDWFLVHVVAAGHSSFAHAYTTHGGLVLNCFSGTPHGPMHTCGSHLLWWIDGRHIEGVRRTVERGWPRSTAKRPGRVSSTVLTVRSSRHDLVIDAALTPEVTTEFTADVTIEALSNSNATRISDHAVAVAAWPRGIVPPVWPTGRRQHTVTFDRL